MPLVHLLGPGLAHRAPDLGRTDRIIADLGMALRMRIDPTAHVARQHLATETDAEKGLLFLERHRDPVDLAPYELLRIVGARRAAENDRTGVIRHRVGQRIAKAWVADVEGIAALGQRTTDPSGRGAVAVQNRQDRLAGRRHHAKPGQGRRLPCRASTTASARWLGVRRTRKGTRLWGKAGISRGRPVSKAR